MRRYVILAGLLAIAGCSDPATSRLGAGSEMVVRSPDRPPSPTRPLGEGEFDGNVLASKAVWMKIGDLPGAGVVEAGTRVRILSDDQVSDIRQAEQDFPDVDGPVDRRWVKVKILGGLSAGIVGELPRNTRRPAP